MRRTKQQAAATRQTILEAAADLFAEHEFDGVSLDQIAAASGVKRGAVHFHFGNKQGVLLAICENERHPLQEFVDRLEAERTTPLLDGLLAVTVETLTSFDGNLRRRALLRGLLTVGLRLEDDSHRMFVAFERKLLQLHVTVFEAAEASHTLASTWTARASALAYHSCVMGLLLQWVTSEKGAQLSPDGPDVLRCLIASMGRPPAPPPGSNGVEDRTTGDAPPPGTVPLARRTALT